MMLKMAGVVFCEILIYTLLRQYKPEFAPLSEIAAVVVIFFMLTDEIKEAFGVFDAFFSECGISSEYISVLIKVAGTAFITQLTADMCRDSGECALASKVEFAGKIIITAASLPIIKGFAGFVAQLV